MPATVSTFGLTGWPAKLVLIAMVIVGAIVAFALVRWLLPRLIARAPEGRDPARARQQKTAFALLSTMLRYVILIAATIAIVVILIGGGGAGALGGSAVLAIILGFASQRLLADMIAGFFILFEGQYGVGDIIALEPSGHTGVVQEVGVRTTILRDANGDRCFIPNGQIAAVRRYPSPRSMLSVTLLTRDPDAAEAALGRIGALAGLDAGVAASAQSVTRQEVGGDTTAVRGRVAVSAMVSDHARELVAAVLAARLGETLTAEPVVAMVEPRAPERPEPAVVE